MTLEQGFVTKKLIELLDHWRTIAKSAQEQVEQLQIELEHIEDILEVPESERRGRRPEGA